MEFAHPHFLWLLTLLPALGIWQWRRRRRALRYPHALLLAGLPCGRTRRARIIGLGGRLIILALLVLALARPRVPSEGQRIPVQGLAVVMLLDVSGSMAEHDFLLEGR